MMRNTRRMGAALLLLCWGMAAHASGQNLQFEHLSLEHGLSQTSISCIYQDSKGFLWIGTQDGLNKYDGYAFTIYKPVPFTNTTLSNTMIRAIHEDAGGNLWIGTGDGGLNLLDRNTEQFKRWVHNPEDSTSLSSNHVSSIAAADNGRLWIGTEGGGLNLFDPKTGTFQRFMNEPGHAGSLSSDAVHALFLDRDGVLWIGTGKGLKGGGGGLNRYNPSTGEFISWRHDPQDPTTISNDNISTIYEDSKRRLWIGTAGGGLNRLDRETGRFQHWARNPGTPGGMSSNYITALHEDRKGQLWIGTHGQGVHILDPHTNMLTHYATDATDGRSLSENTILSIYEDLSGVIWIGTHGGGLNLYNPDKSRFLHLVHSPDDSNSLSDNFIYPIKEAPNGHIWIGTLGGLDEYDPITGGFGNFRHWECQPENEDGLTCNAISSLDIDRDGVVWIGTFNNGLDALNPRTGRVTHYVHDPENPHSLSNNAARECMLDLEDNLWIGTMRGGLNRLDRTTQTFRHWRHDPENPNSLLSDNIGSLDRDSRGFIWIGYFGDGLSRFDPVTETFRHWVHDPNDPTSLSNNVIMSVYEDRQGIIWVSTYGGGLNRLDESTGTFRHYLEKDGLPNNVVYGILEDGQGFLWLSTNKGLSKFNPATGIFVNYDIHDGLQSNEFNACAHLKTSGGEMYFGGVNGLTIFHPDKIEVNPHSPPVVITAFKKYDTVVGRDIAGRAEFHLTHTDRFLSFEFQALDYRNPGKNQYRYRLQGFEKDWIFAGNRRFATYTNLDPGAYVFQVRGSNNDGVWNETGAEVHLDIAPPFWATWWFRGGAVAVVLALTVLLVRLKLAVVRRQNQRLEQEVAVRTEELADRNDRLETAVRELQEAQAQLVQSEKMASLGNLAAGVAHEVNNPIGAVSSAADIAERCISKINDLVAGSRTIDDLRQNQKFQQIVHILLQNNQIIETASTQIAKIVQSLKNFARLDEGDFQKTDIHEGLESTLALVNHAMKNKVKLIKEYGQIPHIECYPLQLNQIFMNLLMNAIQAIDETGEIRIATSADEDFVYVRIEDTGKGIPPEHLSRIFDPGFTTKGVGVGTGLGLSICYQIIQKHRGTIKVESKPGIGSTFTVTLPIKVSEGISVN